MHAPTTHRTETATMAATETDILTRRLVHQHAAFLPSTSTAAATTTTTTTTAVAVGGGRQGLNADHIHKHQALCTRGEFQHKRQFQ